uniref:Uncharacterized protein n=1 Tax=Arundo donax TaxID=35708 RepID=A0A0A9HKY2_ARUDO
MKGRIYVCMFVHVCMDICKSIVLDCKFV